ncbi:WD40-repeat-containing domain protein [Blastocladiella britannica]|nr:WD40-repeat-containing domain protein [Blastocladiella britannica]
MDRESVLQLIVAQLQHYDCAPIAQVVASTCGLDDYALDPSDRLEVLLSLGLRAEAGGLVPNSPTTATIKSEPTATVVKPEPGLGQVDNINANNDDHMDTDTRDPFAASGPTDSDATGGVATASAAAADPDTLVFRPAADVPVARLPALREAYAARPGPAISAMQYTPDGKFLVAGAVDGTLRVYHSDRLLSSPSSSSSSSSRRSGGSGDPLFKTMTEHSGNAHKEPTATHLQSLPRAVFGAGAGSGPSAIHDVTFHPTSTLAATAAEDCTIRIYDVPRESGRKSFRFCEDSYPVYSVSWHPAGQYVLAGTAHSALRMYDVQTFKCFTASAAGGRDPNASSDETLGGVSNAITRVRCNPDGSLAATASADGCVRLYDMRAAKVTETHKALHSGKRITGLHWSKSGAYLLTTGEDATARLLEVRTGRTLRVYYQGTATLPIRAGPPVTYAPGPAAVLSRDERHVLGIGQDGKATAWDVLSGEIVERWAPDSVAITVAPPTADSSIVAVGLDGGFKVYACDA